MKEFDAFLSVFGDITILHVVELCSALAFIYFIYKKASKFLIDQYEAQKIKDAQLKEALDGVHKYPEYRQQSLEIQKELNDKIQDLKESQQELREAQQEIIKHLAEIEEQKKRRERNKLRDLLLKYYRRYASVESNPSQSWPKIEAEAFWALFEDYQEAGGNGYMEEEVAPAMRRLNITEN